MIPQCDFESYIMKDPVTSMNNNQGNLSLVYDKMEHTDSPNPTPLYIYKRYNSIWAYKRELDVQRFVEHDNIVRAFCKMDSDKGIMLDYLGDGDLWSDRGLPYNTPYMDIVKYSAQIVLAVEAMHNMGYLHFDIKPQNLVRKGKSHIELTDFGLSMRKERTRFGIGTPITMSPEVRNKCKFRKKDLHEGLDWWSVGSTIYIMHRISMIQDGTSRLRSATLAKIKSNTKPDILALGLPKELSENLSSLLDMLMVENPSDRRFSGEDVARIKKHPYFKDIDWESVGKRESIAV